MIIPKFIIDQSIINNEKLLLNNILTQQRQLKQTLALFLEKISDGIYNATDIQDSTSLISCLDGIKKSFGNIKENINQILELKKYLDDSSLTSYDSSYFEEYNKRYMELFKKISEDNVFYYSFMESLLKYMEVHFPEKSTNDEQQSYKYAQEADLKLDKVKVLNIDDFRIPAESGKKIVNSVNSNDTLNSFAIQTDYKTNLNNLDSFNNSNILNTLDLLNSQSNQTSISNQEHSNNINNINNLNNLNDINSTSSLINSSNDISAQINSEFFGDTNTTNINKNSNTDSFKNNVSERTLYVSPSHKSAILPYSTDELETCFSNNPEKYSSIQDIIDKEYTVSLKNFQNSAISRFKETYNLARNKSRFSILKSLSLANELLFTSNVDPVIIRACKNVNELYIYLSCLEDNILNEFRCFKIVYET